MQKLRTISPFRLSSLLRQQKDPNQALRLFLNPNPNSKPFRYSPLSYDLIISKLARARMFAEMENIVQKLKNDTRIIPEELIFCNIITYYGRAGLTDKALRMFHEIPSFRCRRTIKSVNTLLSSLLICRQFEKMRELVFRIEEFGSPDACTYNILIHVCCMASDIDRAWQVFDEMRGRAIEPNVVTFGTLIHGLCRNSELDKAFALKRRMEREFSIRPNAHIYAVLIKGLSNIGGLGKAIELKDEMLKRKVELKPAVYSALISAFFKAGLQVQVPGLLEEMRRNGCKPDTVVYNAMIHGFCLRKDFDSAFAALSKMENEGYKPDVISYNVIISGLCREGRAKEAIELLEDMPCWPDVVTYKTVFDGLCNVNQFKDAASILDEMIYNGYVPGCSSMSRFVDRVVRGKEVEVWMFLIHLVKRNCVDRYIWRLVTSLVCHKEDADENVLFNSLTKRWSVCDSA